MRFDKRYNSYLVFGVLMGLIFNLLFLIYELYLLVVVGFFFTILISFEIAENDYKQREYNKIFH